MTQFRPCIDLHEGKVKQIVGGTLRDACHLPHSSPPLNSASLEVNAGPGKPANSTVENHVSPHSAAFFAQRYRKDGLRGGHVIRLGPGNDQEAESALNAYPHGLQIGGGINPDNAVAWLESGASHVIVTSWLFDKEGKFELERLLQLKKQIGKHRLVIDLSCRRVQDGGWRVASSRWQTITTLSLSHDNLGMISEHCAEFLIHAADVEGRQAGIDHELVAHLSKRIEIPTTYAGGIAGYADIDTIREHSDGKMDYTVGSALDLFGGTQLKYDALVLLNQQN